MLYRSPTTPVKKLSGRAISSLDLSKSQLAAYAAMAALGERELDDLTRKQICKVFGVSPNYLSKAIALSSATREAVSRGEVPLSDIPTVPTARVLRKTVRDAGVAATWRELEPLI
jgi:hypothetical protein